MAFQEALKKAVRLVDADGQPCGASGTRALGIFGAQSRKSPHSPVKTIRGALMHTLSVYDFNMATEDLDHYLVVNKEVLATILMTLGISVKSISQIEVHFKEHDEEVSYLLRTLCNTVRDMELNKHSIPESFESAISCQSKVSNVPLTPNPNWSNFVPRKIFF